MHPGSGNLGVRAVTPNVGDMHGGSASEATLESSPKKSSHAVVCFSTNTFYPPTLGIIFISILLFSVQKLLKNQVAQSPRQHMLIAYSAMANEMQRSTGRHMLQAQQSKEWCSAATMQISE